MLGAIDADDAGAQLRLILMPRTIALFHSGPILDCVLLVDAIDPAYDGVDSPIGVNRVVVIVEQDSDFGILSAGNLFGGLYNRAGLAFERSVPGLCRLYERQ